MQLILCRLKTLTHLTAPPIHQQHFLEEVEESEGVLVAVLAEGAESAEVKSNRAERKMQHKLSFICLYKIGGCDVVDASNS